MPNKISSLEWLRVAYHDLLSAKILYDADHFTDASNSNQHFQTTKKAHNPQTIVTPITISTQLSYQSHNHTDK